jgi:hypothetical protein
MKACARKEKSSFNDATVRASGGSSEQVLVKVDLDTRYTTSRSIITAAIPVDSINSNEGAMHSS